MCIEKKMRKRHPTHLPSWNGLNSLRIGPLTGLDLSPTLISWSFVYYLYATYKQFVLSVLNYVLLICTLRCKIMFLHYLKLWIPTSQILGPPRGAIVIKREGRCFIYMKLVVHCFQRCNLFHIGQYSISSEDPHELCIKFDYHSYKTTRGGCFFHEIKTLDCVELLTTWGNLPLVLAKGTSTTTHIIMHR